MAAKSNPPTDLLERQIRLEAKQDHIVEKLSDIQKSVDNNGVKLGEYNDQLTLHIRRSGEMEEQTKIMRSEYVKLAQEADCRISQLEEPFKILRSLGKGLSWLYKVIKIVSAILAAVSAIWAFLHLFWGKF